MVVSISGIDDLSVMAKFACKSLVPRVVAMKLHP